MGKKQSGNSLASLVRYCEDSRATSGTVYRLNRDKARPLLAAGLGVLPASPPADGEPHRADYYRARVRNAMRAEAHRRYGNPIILIIVLQVLVPVLVRLLIEWWFNRDGGE